VLVPSVMQALADAVGTPESQFDGLLQLLLPSVQVVPQEISARAGLGPSDSNARAPITIAKERMHTDGASPTLTANGL